MGCYYDTLQSAKVVLADELKRKDKLIRLRVAQYSMDGTLIKIWNNPSQVEKAFKMGKSNLMRRLNKTHGKAFIKGFRLVLLGE